MSEIETRVAKTTADEFIDDWVEANKPAFDFIRGLPFDDAPVLEPFRDVERFARFAGISEAEVCDKINRRVGDLGNAALKPVLSSHGDGTIDLGIGFQY